MINLKKLRLEKNLTQLEMANRLKVARTTYQSYEQGINQMNYETLKATAEIFQTSIDNLLNFENPGKLDLGSLTKEQNNIINKVIQLNRENTLRLEAYAEGLLEGQREHENKVRKILGE